MKSKFKKITFFLLSFILSCSNLNNSIENTPHKYINYIHDYRYIKNRFFFIDSNYKDQFEEAYSQDLQTFSAENSQIKKIEVFLGTINETEDTNIKGLATLKPDEFTGIKTRELDSLFKDDSPPANNIHQIAYFKKLDIDKDYKVDSLRGFIYLNISIESRKILGISYRTKNKQIGTFKSELKIDSTLALVLKLIKLPDIYITEPSWDLMMKNVYSMGATKINPENFKIEIQNISNKSPEVYDSSKTFLNLLGLDILDANRNYIEGGDGFADINHYTIDLENGILIFPSLQPFNPAPSSRFQISEKNKANIYLSSRYDILSQNSKFEILIKYQDKQ